MKTYITHHKGVGKLKIWKSSSSASDIYNSLLANRGIDAADLDIYEVTDGQSKLSSPCCFSVSDTLIECKEEYIGYEDYTHESSTYSREAVFTRVIQAIAVTKLVI